ncbi:hypothetical protein KEJ21_03715 [Candidatus Bathyarchaeota archaeon]|nr:hypothetical protein [Candidatus Bathyarchaeota archaeon]MBS7631654.1 hypothetical protein [Candidatus Bathyarchaeota archaeon]
MPSEIFEPEEFLALADKASECRIKRLGDIMKLKLRTSKRLYTIVLDKTEGEEVLSKIKCPKKEV